MFRLLDATQQLVREPRRNMVKYINICTKDAKMTNACQPKR